MKLINILVVNNLRLNKKKTIVTIIGIILATSLITSVITLFSSFLKSTTENIKKSIGDYHYEFLNVPIREIKNIENKQNIESLFTTQDVGFVFLKDKEYCYDKKIKFYAFSEEAFQKLGIRLVEGKIPENKNEIIISNKINDLQGINIEIGENILLEVQGNIKKTNMYKVVGIANITNEEIESKNVNHDSYQYTFITYLDNYNDKPLNVYVRYGNLSQRINTAKEILEVDEEEFKLLQGSNRSITEKNLYENETNKYKYLVNNQLILIESGDFNDNTTEMLFFVALVVIIIIMTTSILCIKNSFAISFTEKIRQYGMLASIGATKKQIKRYVLYEAFILGIISIPLGILIGLTAIYVLLKFTENMLEDGLLGTNLIFNINVVAIVITVLLSFLIIYLSAITLARKASRVSPIEAIKSNNEVKITSKDIKTSKLIKKVFGIGGDIAYKNLKRNKKKYRVIVVSIIVSISLFIAMSSFINYAFRVQILYYENYHYNIYLENTKENNYKEIINMVNNLDIKDYSIVREVRGYKVKDEDKHYTDEAIKFKYNKLGMLIISIGKEEYNKYIKRLGLNYNETKDKGILINYKNTILDSNGYKVNKILEMYNYQKNDVLEIYNEEYTSDKIEFTVELAKVTNEEPMHLRDTRDTSYKGAYLVVSDEFIEKMGLETDRCSLYINEKNDMELEKYIEENYSEVYSYLGNKDREEREQKMMSIIISIFLYGFITVISLIGVTNIFNTITTSIELRKKEFANLKAIGMTKKEFSKMINLESIFYIIKSLIISILVGIMLSYIIYKAFSTNIEMQYIMPVKEICIASVSILILVFFIMRYSIKKINKKNIIEIIRNENI